MNFQLKWATHLHMAELWLQFLIARVYPRISISKDLNFQWVSKLLQLTIYHSGLAQRCPITSNHGWSPTFWSSNHIKSLFQLSLSFLEFWFFRFAEKKNSFFFWFGTAPKMFFSHPFFLLVKSPCSPVNFIPWAPWAPTGPTSRDSTAVPPRGSTSDWRARRATPRGTSNGDRYGGPQRDGWGAPNRAKLKCLLSSMDWFKIYGKPEVLSTKGVKGILKGFNMVGLSKIFVDWFKGKSSQETMGFPKKGSSSFFPSAPKI